MSLSQCSLGIDVRADWIGGVPSHWRVEALKRSFSIVGGSTPDSDNTEYWDGDIVWVSPADLSKLPSIFISDSARRITQEGFDSCATKLVPPQSIVLSTRAPIGSLGIAATTLCTNQGCKSLVPSDGVHSPYFAYVLLSATEALNLRGKGTTFLELSADELATFRVPVPPYDEQVEIATFLDREIAKIDALTAEQERLIALLAEKRQATIVSSVARGINAAVSMKDSGVGWLGSVPAHWLVGKIQSFARRETGHTPSRQRPEYWENCDIPWITLADVWQIRNGRLKYISDTKEKISELGAANSAARLLPAGTVILSRTASVGYSAIMAIDMATTQDFINWVCSSKLKPEFLLYTLRGMRSEFDRLMMGSTHQTIYMPDVAKLMMALPPLDEQDEIINFLDNAILDLDNLQDKAARLIVLLKERRASLLTAAITGRIDVNASRAASKPLVESHSK